MNISGYTEAFSFVQQDSQTSKWCSYFKHILTGKKRRKSDEEKTYDEKLNQVAHELKVAEEKNEYIASTTTNTIDNSTEKRA